MDCNTLFTPALLVQLPYRENKIHLHNVDEIGNEYDVDYLYSPYNGAKLKPVYDTEVHFYDVIPTKYENEREIHPKFKSYIKEYRNNPNYQFQEYHMNYQNVSDYEYATLDRNSLPNELKLYIPEVNLIHIGQSSEFYHWSHSNYTISYLEKCLNKFKEIHSELLSLLNQNEITYQIVIHNSIKQY